MPRILILLTLLTLAACKTKPDAEVVPKGSKNFQSFKQYFNLMKVTHNAPPTVRVQWFDDVENGMIITTSIVDGCVNFKKIVLAPGGANEMPDNTYVSCREDAQVKWNLDRR